MDIAFKKAKNCPNVSQDLHPEMILEHIPASLVPEDKLADYETLPEAEFQAELALNDQRHQEFMVQREADASAQAQAKALTNQSKIQEMLALKAEFEAFKAWKASQQS